MSISFCPENFVGFIHLLHMDSNAFLNMEANTISPDQTDPKEPSDLSSYCVHYRLPKNISW